MPVTPTNCGPLIIKRVVLVADRGLLSLDNLEELKQIQVAGHALEFILAVPARRYGDFDALLAGFQERCRSATEEITAEEAWQGYRLIVAHRPDVAAEQSRLRDERIAELEAHAAKWANSRKSRSHRCSTG